MPGWFRRLMILAAAGQLLVYGLRPLLSYVALSVGSTPADLGVITAAFSAPSLLAAVPFGLLVDRAGERAFVVVGSFALLFVPAFLLARQNVATLMACSAILGLGQLATALAVQTSIARGTSEAVRDRHFAHLTVVTSGAQLLAPAALGMLVVMTAGNGQRRPQFDAHTALLAAIAVACVGLIAAFSLALRQQAPSAQAAVVVPHLLDSMRRALRLPSMRGAMLASFTVLASLDLITAYLPLLGHAHGLAIHTVGFLLATLGGTSMAARLVLPRLVALFGRRLLLVLCMALAAVSMVALPFVTWLPAVFGVMGLAGVGLGLGQPITMGWVANEVAAEIRGTAMSVRLMGNRLGQTVVPLFVGAVAGASGLASAFVVPGVMLAGAAIAVLAAVPRTS